MYIRGGAPLWAVNFSNGNKAALSSFIGEARELGLPTRMLSYVQQNYRLARKPNWVGGEEHIKPALDLMILFERTWSYLKRFRSEMSAGELSGYERVATLYHESAHAYVDLKLDQEDPRVLAVMVVGRAHYYKAPLKDGRTATDPQEIAIEAIGNYVQDRVEIWLATMYQLRSAKEMVLGGKATHATALSHIRKSLREYDLEMTKVATRPHGYQTIGGVSVETTRRIHPYLKQFCDHDLLENKLPDSNVVVMPFLRELKEL